MNAPDQTAEPSIKVVPLPASYQIKPGGLPITASFGVYIASDSGPVLRLAVHRFLQNLSQETGIPLSDTLAASPDASFSVSARRPSPAVPEAADESYTLDVGTSRATLTAPTSLGALHGLETFLQLVRATPSGFMAQAIHVDDSPRFAWRGLMIDVSRHFEPLPVLERNLDAMAAVKMNVLHLHLSDDQAFRIESKRFPQLQQLGSNGQFYTQAQIRALLAYARDRGIRVVPEFDMPGHATSWFVGYPRLASGPGPYQLRTRWGPGDAAMDPARESTYKFLDRFIGEMARLFPDPYFHIGGDEVTGKEWQANSKIQAFMRAHDLKDNHDLQRYFNSRVERILDKHHKKMIGWDEILTPELPQGIVIQSWRGPDGLAQAAQDGFPAILSAGYYLDSMAHASDYYAVDPISGAAAGLSPSRQRRILGGEVCMWGEFVTSANIDSRIWPRTAAIAERLWSPRNVTDVTSLYARLDALDWRLEMRGLDDLASYPRNLRRLAESSHIVALRVLGDVVEPVGYGDREKLKQDSGSFYTTLSPLNRLVDAVPPESLLARRFNSVAADFIAGNFRDKDDETFLRSELTLWNQNDARLEPLLARSDLLRELTPLSRGLATVAAAGLAALDAIDAHRPRDASAIADQLASLHEAEAPQADLRLAISSGIESLVKATARSP